jgi:hypothetical protein
MVTLLAFRAKTIDFYHRMSGNESNPGCRIDNGMIDSDIIQLRNRLAAGADQELAAVFGTRVRTANIGIKALNTVYQIKCQQKLQRPINGGRCTVVTLSPKLFKDKVGPDWPVAVPDQFQHPLTLLRQASLPIPANTHRMVHCRPHTTAVIMWLKGVIISGDSRHSAVPSSKKLLYYNIINPGSLLCHH